MRIAVLQMQSGLDPSLNLATIKNGAVEAAEQGAVMLFTPEMSGMLDRNQHRSEDHLCSENTDPVLAGAMQAAAQHKIWIHLGSLALRSGQPERKRLNCSFLIDDTGKVRARYAKIHLFDVSLPTGEVWRESAVYAPGAQSIVAATPLGLLGLSICYDVRFPALYAALSGAGATCLAIPAAFTVPTGQAHWHILMRARAIENACFVVAAAQCGRHEDGRETYGHSLVVDPWGHVILDMQEKIGVGFAEIDISHVETVRNRIPVLTHRRPIGAVDVVA
jgi:deaminated glutathione amidase